MIHTDITYYIFIHRHVNLVFSFFSFKRYVLNYGILIFRKKFIFGKWKISPNFFTIKIDHMMISKQLEDILRKVYN
ncbi:unnamed protein product [Rhizophagus irregularis]|nr:unnamed protein product [Rhizophagus irregularis]